ncbi:unnamed protein product [Adineta steineri]|uniref:Apple domain-containing protein n=1 Tax=Adineta steineri TaxID=433720 RepID=A0A818VF87_9BILA|nr:unnamed protein product [Adineta steineri]CAF3706050.1 unnamed protein product [Adineta steineri]
MSIEAGWQFQCSNTTCLPFVTVTVSNIDNCQVACLAQVDCQVLTFYRSSSNCELFADISNQNGNLSANIDTVTMIAIDRTRIPLACNFFLNQTTYAVSTNPYSVAVVDVDSDYKPDIVVANSGSANVGVLLNAGNGTFNNQTTYTVGNNPHSVVVVDVNSDYKPDIIVANYGSNTVSVLLNAGNGTFNAQTTYPVGNEPYSVAVVDVNSDYKPDIIVANYGSNTVSVLLHC